MHVRNQNNNNKLIFTICTFTGLNSENGAVTAMLINCMQN